MQTTDLEKQAETTLVRWGVPGLSVCAGPFLTVSRLLEFIPDPDRWRTICVSTVGALGHYRLVPTGEFPHYTLVLRSTDPKALEAVKALFTPRGNPAFPSA